MGELEKRTRGRNKKRDIRTAIMLGLIGGVTLAGYAALGPAALAGFAVLGVRGAYRPFESKLKRSLRSLLGKDLVKFVDKGGRKFLAITPEGRSYLRRRRGAGYEVSKPKRWDGKWRVVIFDVKEARRWDRDRLRQELVTIGFFRLQDSVWIYPYDCEDLVTLIKSDYKLGGDVIYIITEELENDRKLKDHFRLNRRLL